MFNWVTSWWIPSETTVPSTTPGNNSTLLNNTLPTTPQGINLATDNVSAGPARNAPNDGKDIKTLFIQQPKRFIVLTTSEINVIRQGLRKTVINQYPPKLRKKPIIAELDSVFEQGNYTYFDSLRTRRRNVKPHDTTSLAAFVELEEDVTEPRYKSFQRKPRYSQDVTEDIFEELLRKLSDNNHIETVKSPIEDLDETIAQLEALLHTNNPDSKL